MQSQPNYYQILHVQADAPIEVIKASYRTLMLQMKQHPDLGGEHVDASLINQAYNVLRNPQKRAEYDRSLQQPITSTTAEKPKQLELICHFCQAPNPQDQQYHLKAQCYNCASPLFTIIDDMQKDSRALLRREIGGTFEFYLHWPGTCFTGEFSDLTVHGLRFYCPVMLNCGQVIKIDSPILQAVAVINNFQLAKDHQQYDYSAGAAFDKVFFPRNRGNFVSVNA